MLPLTLFCLHIKLVYSFAVCGMAQSGGYLVHGAQHKHPFRHSRVGNGEFGRVQNNVVIKQYVNVNRAVVVNAFCVLPRMRSVRCVTSSASCGERAVVNLAAELRNSFADAKPSGAVATGCETETGFRPSCLRSSKARSMFSRLFPRFEPKARNTVWFISLL